MAVSFVAWYESNRSDPHLRTSTSFGTCSNIATYSILSAFMATNRCQAFLERLRSPRVSLWAGTAIYLTAACTTRRRSIICVWQWPALLNSVCWSTPLSFLVSPTGPCMCLRQCHPSSSSSSSSRPCALHSLPQKANLVRHPTSLVCGGSCGSPEEDLKCECHACRRRCLGKNRPFHSIPLCGAFAVFVSSSSCVSLPFVVVVVVIHLGRSSCVGSSDSAPCSAPPIPIP